MTLYAGANAGTNSNRYYSFNRGLTHFIVFTAEAYLYAVDKAFIANQLAFMKADLAAVDRKVTPWVVALVHKDFSMEAEAYADFSPILEGGGVDVLFVSDTRWCRGRCASLSACRSRSSRNLCVYITSQTLQNFSVAMCTIIIGCTPATA